MTQPWLSSQTSRGKTAKRFERMFVDGPAFVIVCLARQFRVTTKKPPLLGGGFCLLGLS
jgi:hypothetical protein